MTPLTLALVAMYVAVGFLYYLSYRRSEGPQGVGSLLASLALGGLTVAVLFTIFVVTAAGYAVFTLARHI